MKKENLIPVNPELAAQENVAIAPERIIDNRLYDEKKSLKVCGLKNNPHLCNAYHLNQASRLANSTLLRAFFMPIAKHIVPSRVVSLMRPQPDSGGKQRGAELFLFPSQSNQHIVSF